VSAGDPTTVHSWPIPYETGHTDTADCPCGPSRHESTSYGQTTTTYKHRRLRPASEALG
jgi:hypothetical protein